MDNQIDQYMDLDIETTHTKKPQMLSSSKYILTKEEALLMKAGVFKKITQTSSDSESGLLRCCKCEAQAELIEYKTNVTYCRQHAIDYAINLPSLLSNIEVEKKSVLEQFSLKVKSSSTKLEELKSMLKLSELTLNHNSAFNLEKINSVFKAVFQQTKILYSQYLDNIAEAANESENTHSRCYNLLREFEEGLKVIDRDISQNFSQIILNMDVDPFKNIITSYNDKVEFNIEGIEAVKNDISKINQLKIDLS